MMMQPDSWSILHPDSPREWRTATGGLRSLPPLRERLTARIQTTGPDDCHPWTGSRNARGYGTLSIDNRAYLVSRVVFRLAFGYWPENVRHTCDNPPCCNPAHYLPGTKLDNAADRDSRGRNGYRNRTHCKRGHEYTPENTRLIRQPAPRQHQTARRCITCANDLRRKKP